ncbi:Fe-S cluster biogenesis protein NfuA [Anseongella ginsenosidimutans]|uniref:Fe-S cluster biogenesis protein NfuA n=1 Tax=Anseongella ginsenosidimutans TaxID=496056 RepID=A0A4R3KMQ0_9SPHI|nr:NifU family protein [Anseongella ginsenosidimutans]QEC52059.1 NifU family protein [Anseongella ginsenosidimutans]TCS85630.1 Fe-S cluster biogenesis protein NfuA [Anseongella ginsenosidimutans]
MKENLAIKEKVEAALGQIRPYLEADGGNVEVLEITEEMVLKLKLVGACGSCPMSIMTLKAGIEETIKRAVPEISAVEAINITDIDDPDAVLPERFR